MEQIHENALQDLEEYFQLIRSSIYRRAILGQPPLKLDDIETKLINMFKIPFANAIARSMCYMGETCPKGFVKTVNSKIFIRDNFAFKDFLLEIDNDKNLSRHLNMLDSSFRIVDEAKRIVDNTGHDDISILCATPQWQRYVKYCLRRMKANSKCAVLSKMTSSIEIVWDVETIDSKRSCNK